MSMLQEQHMLLDNQQCMTPELLGDLPWLIHNRNSYRDNTNSYLYLLKGQ